MKSSAAPSILRARLGFRAKEVSMKRACLVTFTAALVLDSAWAAFAAQVEPPAVLWDRTFLNQACCAAVQETAQGDLVLAGSRNCTKQWGVYIMKTDSQGNPLWERTFNLSADPEVLDSGTSMFIATDGSYVIGGHTGHDFLLLKISEEGNLIWNKTYGKRDASEIIGRVAPTLDGGYILAGYDMAWFSYVVKADGNGDVVWERRFSSRLWPDAVNRLYSVASTPDGGYAVAGSVWVPGDGPNGGEWDAYLANLDGDGKLVSEQSLCSRHDGASTEYAFCVRPTSDGGLVLGGTMFAKLDARGQVAWQEETGWKESPAPRIRTVWMEQTTDGGYVAAGFAPAPQGGGSWFQCWLAQGGSVVKLNDKGDVAWQKDFERGACESVLQTRDGGYVVVGGGDRFNADDCQGALRIVKLAPDSQPAASFQRGDASGDGSLEISDAIQVLSHLFQGGERSGCDDAADANDDGKLDISDPIFSLAYFFQGGLPLPGPSGVCGPDPTPDDLDCKEYRACQ
jgi:hypothetical protein